MPRGTIPTLFLVFVLGFVGCEGSQTSIGQPTIFSVDPGGGDPAGGTVVTITMRNINLTGTSPVVTFGGSPATNVSVVASDQIEATAPPGTGAVTVEVIVGRNSVRAVNAYRYVGIASISPDRDGLPGGTRVTIRTTDFQDFNVAAPTVSIGGNIAPNLLVTSADTVEVDAPRAPNRNNINRNGGFVDVVVEQGSTRATETDGFAYEPTDHLLLSEVRTTGGDFFEIYNPTADPIDLDDYYVSDANDPAGDEWYYKLAAEDPTTRSDAWSGDSDDFLARFPSGFTIPPFSYGVIAVDSDGFTNANFQPNPPVAPSFELTQDGLADNVPDMRVPPFLAAIGVDSLPTGAGGTSTVDLDVNGEGLVLFRWPDPTGTTSDRPDLVEDVDFIQWVVSTEDIDKGPGDVIDGPDGDSTGTSFLDDASTLQPIGTQLNNNQSYQRQFNGYDEGAENEQNGNGITGHDETNEDVQQNSNTWGWIGPTPFGI